MKHNEPPEVQPKASYASLVWVCAYVALLLAAVNLCLGLRLAERRPNRGYAIVERKWELLTRSEKPVDWLIIGDSSCNQGVDPAMLEAQLGGDALNTCTTGDFAAIDGVWMVDTLVAMGQVPRNVIVVHAYDVWRRDDRFVLGALWLLPHRAREVAYASHITSIDSGDRLIGEWGDWLPLYTQSGTLKAAVRKPSVLLNPKPINVDENGFAPERKALPLSVAADRRKHLELLQRSKPEISMVNRRAVEHLTSLGDRYGFNIYLTLSPIDAELARTVLYRRYRQALMAQLSSWTRLSPRVHLVLTEPQTFSLHQLQNVDHVTIQGAREFTQSLILSIRNQRKGGVTE